jgi:trigger factor
MSEQQSKEAESPETTALVTTEENQEGAGAEQGEEELVKLHQTVEMKDIGPCKKHIKVTIERNDIDQILEKQYSELVVDAQVPGFRPGKAPRKLVEKKFQKDVRDRVRGQILLQSLEQLAEENDVAPLTAPNIDPASIRIPEDGPMVYEFEVEVRPEFELGEFKGLKLNRAVREFTDADIAAEEKRLLSNMGTLTPKTEGGAAEGDFLVTDMTTRDGEQELSNHKEITIRVDKRLALKDGYCDDFADAVAGAQAGDKKAFSITLLDSVANPLLQGKTVQAELDIKEVKSLRLPELTESFLERIGFSSEEQFREGILASLKRRHEYEQRLAARDQVMEQLTSSLTWDLPRDLLQRQARRSLQRRLVEMQQAGMSEQEIQGRYRLLQRDILDSTTTALKEHFVLQKIAEVENLDIDEADVDDEIERMAQQNNESPRRVRARLEKGDLMEALATQIVERKALDLILDSAEYTEVPYQATNEPSLGTVEQQAVPGEAREPGQEPAEANASTESGEANS